MFLSLVRPLFAAVELAELPSGFAGGLCRGVCTLRRAAPFGAEEGQSSFNFPRGANIGRRLVLCR